MSILKRKTGLELLASYQREARAQGFIPSWEAMNLAGTTNDGLQRLIREGRITERVLTAPGVNEQQVWVLRADAERILESKIVVMSPGRKPDGGVFAPGVGVVVEPPPQFRGPVVIEEAVMRGPIG